jgi:hypothetical protein
MVQVQVKNGDMTAEEQQAYVAYLEKKHGRRPASLTIGIEDGGEEVTLEYTMPPVPFERIRRITGYLVGTMDRWNNAKVAEEADRRKHRM